MAAKKSRGATSITWRMLGYIAIFTIFMLLIVWIFQVLLLGRFYESTKLAELNRAANEIEENIDNEEALQSLSAHYASEYQMYMRVFETESGVSEQIVGGQIFGSYFIRNAEPGELQRLYNSAAARPDKTYFEPKTIYLRPAGLAGEEHEVDVEERKEMICVRIVKSEDAEYVIMLDILYTPLDATVTTLMKQFSWICLVLLSGAVILAAVLSKWVAQPLVRMNEEAKKLGKGDFNVQFPSGGFLETRELAECYR